MPGVWAWLGRLRKLDLLRRGDRKVEKDAELQQPAQRDEVKVLRGCRERALPGVTAREEAPASQVARVGAERPDVHVTDPRLRAVAADELQELDQKAFVARQR